MNQPQIRSAATGKLKSMPKPRGRLCFDAAHLEFPVRLYQQGRNRFTVVYGLQVKPGLTYGEAASELGAAIMHAKACSGELDNRMPGER